MFSKVFSLLLSFPVSPLRCNVNLPFKIREVKVTFSLDRVQLSSYLSSHNVIETSIQPLAVRWFRLAAEQGQGIAPYNLGVMYANGNGVPQNDVQAHMWFNLAASGATGEGREDAVNSRDLIAERLTPEDLNEAQRRCPRLGRHAPALDTLNRLPPSGRIAVYSDSVVVRQS